jgi:hypothetical protein
MKRLKMKTWLRGLKYGQFKVLITLLPLGFPLSGYLIGCYFLDKDLIGILLT